MEVGDRDVADFLTSRRGLPLAGATMLRSAVGHLQVSQVVDPLKTARFAMPREYTDRPGLPLLPPLRGGRISGGSDG